MDKKIERLIVGAIGTNCWFYQFHEALNKVNEADEDPPGVQICVVIDPGEEAERIISKLQELNWIPGYILLTHGHFDHLAALPDLVNASAKGAFGENQLPKIGIHRMDAHYLGKDALSAHRESMRAAGGSAAYVDALWKSMPDADILFEDGDTIGPFRIVHIPGHTRGSVGFYDEENAVLFSGDTLFRGNWGRTDLPGGDEEEIYKSLKRLLSMESETVVYPGHGPNTKIGNEARLLNG